MLITLDKISYYNDGEFYYIQASTLIDGIIIPKWYSSNLLSAPHWFISLEDGATAGFVHDYLYDKRVSGSRWDADMLLYRLLLPKVGFIRAAIVWMIVRCVAWFWWKSFTRMP